MRLRLLALGLGTALTFLLPLATAEDKKDKKKDDPATLTPLDSDKLLAGDYTGTLLTLPGSDGSFTLQIDFKHLEPKNPAQLSAKEAKLQGQIITAQQKIVTIQTSLATATKAKDITKYQAELQKANAHLMQLQAQSQIKPSDLKEVTDTKVYDMKLTDTADIRNINLPMVFDEDGKEKKYTATELKELRGKKSTLPGYEAKLEDLKIGQLVKVTLYKVPAKPKDPAKDKTDPNKEDAKPADVVKPDEAKKTDDAKKDDPKKADATDPDKPPPEKKMQVKMVVILQDPPDDSTDAKKKKDKKNK